MSPIFNKIPLVGGVVLGFLLAGCSVDYRESEESSLSVNSCERAAECEGGRCIDGQCRAQQSELSAFLLEVVAPSGTPNIAGVNFTRVVRDIENARYDIELDHVSRISGLVVLAESDGASCVKDEGAESYPPSSDGSLPVRITLTPRERLWGLPSPTHSAEVSLLDNETNQYEIALNVPSGKYDIYVEPLGVSDKGCTIPPYLIVDQELVSGDVKLNLQLPPAGPLSVTIDYPTLKDDLSQWIVDIIDRDTGRLLSNRVTLGEPISQGGSLKYMSSLAFSEIGGTSTNTATELVRLSPPEEAVAPILYVERSVVDLFQGGTGLIDQLEELPPPVQFSARSTLLGASKAAPASVHLIAVELLSTRPGTIASFERRVQTDEDGFFQVELLPGQYRMLTEPFDPRLRRSETLVTISDEAETQIGKTIELSQRFRLNGKVMSFQGEPVAGAPVVARSVFQNTNTRVIDYALGRSSPSPSSPGTTSGLNGEFLFWVNPGNYHFSARPEPSTGFAWAILLHVQAEEANADLGRIVLELPVVLGGKLSSKDVGDATAGTDLVPDALIRAYAFLKEGKLADGPESADAVIPIAESRVDGEGRYQLLLPSSLK